VTRTLRLDLSFDGTDFLGWQRQPRGRTVQGEVEAALDRILGPGHTVIGAGRTDTGAHAAAMVASCRTEASMGVRDLARALDAVLPRDVGVLDVREAAEGFHALRDARWKWYRYSVLNAPRRRPLERRRSWQVRPRLDRDVLDAGAAALRGTHDFRAFANQGSPRRSTVRTQFGLRWTGEVGDRLELDVVGDGFLYRMVRAIVGTLVDWARSPAHLAACGPGRVQAAGAAGAVEYLLASGARAAAGPVAPARGLCLMGVGLAGGDSAGGLPPFLPPGVESGRRPSPGGLP
jgi:tRNA pseudouridine38-40 synthase